MWNASWGFGKIPQPLYICQPFRPFQLLPELRDVSTSHRLYVLTAAPRVAASAVAKFGF